MRAFDANPNRSSQSDNGFAAGAVPERIPGMSMNGHTRIEQRAGRHQLPHTHQSISFGRLDSTDSTGSVPVGTALASAPAFRNWTNHPQRPPIPQRAIFMAGEKELAVPNGIAPHLNLRVGLEPGVEHPV